ADPVHDGQRGPGSPLTVSRRGPGSWATVACDRHHHPTPPPRPAPSTVPAHRGDIRMTVSPPCQGARMETSGAVRYRRGMMRAVTPTAIAEQLAEVRRAATAFGVDAVAEALERTAREALAVARTDEESDLARELLGVARQAQVRRSLRR